MNSPPRVLWRRLQEEAQAVGRYGGTITAMTAALKAANSGRFFSTDKGARRDGRDLAKLAERYGRETEACRAELRDPLLDAAARVEQRLDAIWPRPHYRADIDG